MKQLRLTGTTVFVGACESDDELHGDGYAWESASGDGFVREKRWIY